MLYRTWIVTRQSPVLLRIHLGGHGAKKLNYHSVYRPRTYYRPASPECRKPLDDVILNRNTCVHNAFTINIRLVALVNDHTVELPQEDLKVQFWVIRNQIK